MLSDFTPQGRVGDKSVAQGDCSAPPHSVHTWPFLPGPSAGSWAFPPWPECWRLALPAEALAGVLSVQRREKHVLGVGVRGREEEGQGEVNVSVWQGHCVLSLELLGLFWGFILFCFVF